MCHTARVSFNETFWVVAGTAAPVIALAAVIGLADVLRQLVGTLGDPELNPVGVGPENERARPVRVAYVYQVSSLALLGWVNLLAQGFVLLASLLSLNDHRNFIAGWLAILCLIFGILALACSGTVLVWARFNAGWALRALALKRADHGTDRGQDTEPRSPDAG